MAASGDSYHIETHSIDYIPETERHGTVGEQGPFWFLSNFQFLTTSIGFIGPSLGLSFGWTSVAGSLGILFGTLFVAFHATQGPKFGLPQMIQSRAQFGYRGVVCAVLIALITFIGLNVVNALLMMQGLKSLFGWNPDVVLGIIVVATTVIAIFGYQWLHTIFKVLFWLNIPLYLILCTAIVAGHAGGKITSGGGFTITGFLAQFSAAAGYNLAYAPYVSDYSRYLPTRTRPQSIIRMVFIGAAVSAIWLIVLGAWLATHLNVTDALSAIDGAGNAVFHGFGTVLALDAVVVLVIVAAMNTYSSMLSTITAADSFYKLKPTVGLRVKCVVIVTALWTVITLFAGENAVGALLTALTVMLYLLVPWTSINLVDYFFVRKGNYAIGQLLVPGGIYGNWGWRGLAAYGLGLMAIMPFAVLPGLYTGPLARLIGGVDLGWLAGIVVPSLVYYGFAQSLDLDRERMVIARCEVP
jgi:purine-cytosine permease-like protein